MRFFLVLVTNAIVIAPAVLAQPIDGRYSGKTSQNTDIVIAVESGSLRTVDFRYGFPGCIATWVNMFLASMPLSDNSFTINCGPSGIPGDTCSLSGTFDTSNTANGTFEVVLSNVPGPCAGTINGSWNAIRCAPRHAGVYRSGAWFLDVNGNGIWDDGIDRAFGWGWADSVPVVGNWNGDLATEVGVYHQGVWYLDYNGNGVWDSGIDKAFGWGWPDSIPVVGDWNGDGKTEIGVYQQGVWYLDINGNGAWDPGVDRVIGWGWVDSTPVVGDWDGDGRTKIGVYHQGAWYLDYDGSGGWDPLIDRVYGWGNATSKPVVGDWDSSGGVFESGNLRTEIGVFDQGIWYLDYVNNGVFDSNPSPWGDRVYLWGSPNSTPVVGDWNGQCRAQVGVFEDGVWYLDINGNGQWDSGTDRAFAWGAAGDIPVVGSW